MRKLNRSGFSHILVLVLVLVGVAGVGTYLLVKGHAEPPFLTDSNAIVAEYQSSMAVQATQSSDGTILNEMSPGDVIVTGDGTMYCNILGNGTTTTAQMPPGQLKNLFDNLHTPSLAALAHRQLSSLVSSTLNTVSSAVNSVTSSANVIGSGVVVINGTDGAEGIYGAGDTTGIYTASVQAMQKWCTNTHPTQVVKVLPQFQDLNPTSDSSAVSALEKLFGVGQVYATVTPTALSGGGLQSDINNHRDSTYDSSNGYSTDSGQPKTYESNHTPPAASTSPPYKLTRPTCMDNVAGPWAKKMAISGVLQHNPNLYNQISSHCGNKWTSAGEDVGVAGSEGQVFNALLKSCPHHENIDDRPLTLNSHFDGTSCKFSNSSGNPTVTYTRSHYNQDGIGAYADNRSINSDWYVVDFAAY